MDLLKHFYQLVHQTPHLSPNLSHLDLLLLIVKDLISMVGSIIIFSGVIVGLYRFFIVFFFPVVASKENLSIGSIRRELGKIIVLGLEFIMAADIVETTTTPDYYSLGILVIIVLVRTFLSFALNKEITELASSQKI